MCIFNSKNSKYFIVKVIFFGITIILLLILLNSIYCLKNLSDNDRTEKFNDIVHNIIISNTGSSHGLYGFNYESVKGYNCFNFALESQSLSYDYRVLLQYEEYLSDGGTMFIPVSFFSLYGLKETDKESFQSKNNRYYKILKPSLIKEYNLVDDFKYHILPVINDENVIQTLIEGKDTTEEYKNIWYRKASDSQSIETDAEDTYRRHYIGNGNIIETMEINKEEIQALYDIILFCNNKNITPILVTTPLMEEYKNRISKEYLQDFYKQIDSVTTATNAIYKDYSSDLRFADKPELFMNVDHLNIDGARVFTNILLEENIKEGSKK